ncbi:hypothetical protein TCEA9_17710 [Thermobrachium celere]|nr:hypothetical protein TCEA9_17710 [Thermobrachium celere]
MKYLYMFILAALLSFILTPLAKKIAYRLNAIDVPKDDRRLHKKPIPRLGGLAIFFILFNSINMLCWKTRRFGWYINRCNHNCYYGNYR